MSSKFNLLVAAAAVGLSAAAAAQTTHSTGHGPATPPQTTAPGQNQAMPGAASQTAPGQTESTPGQMQTTPGEASTMTPADTGQTPSGQTSGTASSTTATTTTSATAADVKKGVSVYDQSGALVGKIDSVSGKGAVLNTGTTRAEIPIGSLARGEKGLVIGMSKADIDAAAKKSSTKPK